MLLLGPMVLLPYYTRYHQMIQGNTIRKQSIFFLLCFSCLSTTSTRQALLLSQPFTFNQLLFLLTFISTLQSYILITCCKSQASIMLKVDDEEELCSKGHYISNGSDSHHHQQAFCLGMRVGRAVTKKCGKGLGYEKPWFNIFTINTCLLFHCRCH